jgi:lysophospholipid acyltransferase (LPLAT)-like uncharacterized protein
MKIPPSFLGRIIWIVLRGIFFTMSVKKVGFGNVDAFNGKPAIYALWHGRMLIPFGTMSDRGIYVLVSEHRDGEIVAKTIELVGNLTIRGSSTRGGVKALAVLIRILKTGGQVAFTPDGPRGPNQKVQPGVIFLAIKTGTPIIPMSSSASKAFYFKSWDSFQLPLPFSKGVNVVGEPYIADGGTDEENINRHCAALEKILVDLTEKADGIVGVKPV